MTTPDPTWSLALTYAIASLLIGALLGGFATRLYLNRQWIKALRQLGQPLTAARAIAQIEGISVSDACGRVPGADAQRVAQAATDRIGTRVAAARIAQGGAE